MIHHIKRATRHLIFWSLIALAISLSALRLIIAEIDHFKLSLSAQLSEQIGAPVSINGLGANMRGLSPELVLKNLIVHASSNEQPAVILKEIRLGINLVHLLLKHSILSSAQITVVGAKFTVQRQVNQQIGIVGLSSKDPNPPNWLFEGGQLELLDSEITWQDDSQQTPSISFTELDMALINTNDQHKINALIKLPEQYGKQLKLAVDLSSNPFSSHHLDGKLYLEADHLQAASWLNRSLSQDMHIQSGTGDFKLWSHFQHSTLVSLSGAIDLHQITLHKPNTDDFVVKSLASQFRWQSDLTPPNPWQLDIAHLLLETGAQKWADLQLRLTGQAAKSLNPDKLALHTEHINIAAVVDAIRFFSPLAGHQNALLRQANPTGKLEQLTVFADRQTNTAAINGRFLGVSFAPFGDLPGIENLTGDLNTSNTQGRLHLNTQAATVTAPTWFNEPLIIKGLTTQLQWHQRGKGWELSSPSLQLDLLGLHANSHFLATFPEHKTPELDMQMDLVCEDASQLKHYLPAGIIKPADMAWLSRAFVKGRIPQGRLSYLGQLGQLMTIPSAPLKKAPRLASVRADLLPGHEGLYTIQSKDMLGGALFEAILNISELELDYAPDWPPITDIAGELRFLQGRMEVSAEQGFSNHLQASNTMVINEAVGKSKQLSVQGDITGDIASALSFLQQTPLNERVGSLINAIEPQGKTKIGLNLLIPLSEDVMPKVDGGAALNNASLTVKSVDLAIKQITGILKFSENGIFSDTIHASIFKRPVRIRVDNADDQTRVDVQGAAGITDIEKQFNLPAWDVAEGILDYQLKLILPNDRLGNGTVEKVSDKTAELLIDSDLIGVELQLPGDLLKTKLQARPLSVAFNLGDKSILPMTAVYDSQLKAAIRFDTVKHRVESGHILVGNGEPEHSKTAGLKLEINRDQLDLQDWLILKSDASSSSNADIRAISLHSDHAYWGDTALGRFNLLLTPTTEAWTGLLDSALASGKLHIPLNKGRIGLFLDRLDLSALKQLTEQKKSIKTEAVSASRLNPNAIPLIQLTSNQTLWQAVDLGLLNLQTERLANGLALSQLELNGVTQKLTITGAWTEQAVHGNTELQGQLFMPNAGALLAQLGITNDLAETSGTANFSVHWQDAPQNFSLASLRGNLAIDFAEGRILSIDPGFGRILGVLAMAQWAKRLQLDFRDLYQEGLTFNSIKGNFLLATGKAHSNDLIIDAIPAKITMTGETNLINKTLDQWVSIVPKGAEAVPIAGTIMDKITSLIAKTVTGENQEGFLLGSQYRLMGRWDATQVVPVHDHDGLLQKTWKGITDFPWLQPQP
ncbi:MAG: TIGR02099 family protein [Methylovulum sp.]|nr:TIGR02099 family protein [Methylovulum sp.]MCF7999751.1 TIGR02099 family protein [Methylovulum sp.]